MNLDEIELALSTGNKLTSKEVYWLINRVKTLAEAIWPFAHIHKSCWEIQDYITGEGSSERAFKAFTFDAGPEPVEKDKT